MAKKRKKKGANPIFADPHLRNLMQTAGDASPSFHNDLAQFASWFAHKAPTGESLAAFHAEGVQRTGDLVVADRHAFGAHADVHVDGNIRVDDQALLAVVGNVTCDSLEVSYGGTFLCAGNLICKNLIDVDHQDSISRCWGSVSARFISSGWRGGSLTILGDRVSALLVDAHIRIGPNTVVDCGVLEQFSLLHHLQPDFTTLSKWESLDDSRVRTVAKQLGLEFDEATEPETLFELGQTHCQDRQWVAQGDLIDRIRKGEFDGFSLP